jgi:hypothetical protein
MARTIAAVIFGLLAVSVARGHFPFIVPDEKGDSAKVVFSDDLNPDTNVNIEKLANTKLVVRAANGMKSAGEWKKGDGFYTLAVPGSGSRVVYGVTEFGVLQKGDAKPFLLTYYPKAVLGTATAPETVIGDKFPLEIVATGTPGKIRFQVLASGNPVGDLEVTVLPPGGDKKKAVKTDKDGFTPEFTVLGRYGVIVRRTVSKAGEHAGMKYDESRHYATLVCTVEK